MAMKEDGLLVDGLDRTQHIFFTGKGGNGKTSLACATAITLADSGKHVLLVSTDPASNLDEVLGEDLSQSVDKPTKVASVENLWAANIDPNNSAALYRERVLEGLRSQNETPEKMAVVAEQLSGQCTVEIAAFDEFAGLLAGEKSSGIHFDHVVFDTAPTGHTLRLLALPAAWTEFFDGNQQGASCLGPVSALQSSRSRFEAALATLKNGVTTSVYLVTRPEQRSIAECERTSAEMAALGITNQRVIVNGVLPQPADVQDAVASALADRQQAALATVSPAMQRLIAGQVPLCSFNMVGVDCLRSLLRASSEIATATVVDSPLASLSARPLQGLVQEVEAASSGLVMVMGKGGVGKTTVAVALALALSERGHAVHLSTTDPAAHVEATLGSDAKLPKLRVSSVDPRAVTQRYIDEAVSARGPMDEAAKALFLEDLNSPCTEEIAVFEAFAELIAEAQRPKQFVVVDTAPTGHTLLLMDASGAYERELQKKNVDALTPLHVLRDSALTKVVLATLPETTPISEALRLKEDLCRAGIKPYAWVLNQCLPVNAANPLLRARAALQQEQAARLANEHVFRAELLPEEPTGSTLLKKLMGEFQNPQDSGGGVNPNAVVTNLESEGAFQKVLAIPDRPVAVLFDADWATKTDLRTFAQWLQSQVPENSVFVVREGSDDSLDDVIMDEEVQNFPTLCFYAGGQRAARHDNLPGAKRAAHTVMRVPESSLGDFSLDLPSKRPKFDPTEFSSSKSQNGYESSKPAMVLPADLRRAGVIGGC